jgi:hypothetical protein
VALTGDILPPALVPYKWKPGVSANPLGPNANPERREMTEAARSHSVEAIERLAHLMLNAKSEAVQAMCANMLLDRGWGKPKLTVDVPEQGRTLEQILRAIAATREAEKAANSSANGSNELKPLAGND